MRIVAFRLRALLLNPDFRFHRHTGPEAFESRLPVLKADSHWRSLDDLYKVPGGVFGREETGDRAGGGGHAFDVSVEIGCQGIDVHACALAGSHSPKLGLPEVRCDPQIGGLGDQHDLLPGRNV